MHHNMVCLIGMLTLAKKKLCWYNTLAHLLFLACDLNIFCWRSKAFVILKRQFTPKCILTCSAIYPSRYFWCEVRSFGDINCRDVCFLSSIMALMEIVGTGLKKETYQQCFFWTMPADGVWRKHASSMHRQEAGAHPRMRWKHEWPLWLSCDGS